MVRGSSRRRPHRVHNTRRCFRPISFGGTPHHLQPLRADGGGAAIALHMQRRRSSKPFLAERPAIASLMALPDWCTRAGSAVSFRKEVIQPQVPLRLPCYDLVPIAEFILGAWLLAVTSATSDAPHFRGLTGGVYKAQEHIHRGMLTRDY